MLDIKGMERHELYDVIKIYKATLRTIEENDRNSETIEEFKSIIKMCRDELYVINTLENLFEI